MLMPFISALINFNENGFFELTNTQLFLDNIQILDRSVKRCLIFFINAIAQIMEMEAIKKQMGAQLQAFMKQQTTPPYPEEVNDSACATQVFCGP